MELILDSTARLLESIANAIGRHEEIPEDVRENAERIARHIDRYIDHYLPIDE
jgi:MoxR-like ATPase